MLRRKIISFREKNSQFCSSSRPAQHKHPFSLNAVVTREGRGGGRWERKARASLYASVQEDDRLKEK